MAKDLMGYSVQGFRVSVPTASPIEIPAVEGQIKIFVRSVSGSSLEFGGASLTAGNGFLVAIGVNTYPIEFFGSGSIWAIATGATHVLTGLRVLSAGNPGNIG